MAESFFIAILIAVIQGITEWLPVSSSGHLVLAEKIFGYSGGLDFEVALHFGTLMAVFVYFGKDIIDIIRDIFSGKWDSEKGKLGWLVIVATIPAAIVGFIFKSVFENAFTDLWIVAASFGVSGMFLIVASVYKGGKRKEKFGFGRAFVVGVAQIFALFPGISRSGSTYGTGLLMGLNEKNSLKFSFLMSIPIIFGANIVAIGNKSLESSLIWATLVSFIIGLGTIHILYRKILTNRKNLKWFGIYALVLAVVLAAVLVFA